jgi:hypothetical protein
MIAVGSMAEQIENKSLERSANLRFLRGFSNILRSVTVMATTSEMSSGCLSGVMQSAHHPPSRQPQAYRRS